MTMAHLRRHKLLASAAVALSAFGLAHAANTTWTGGSGNWDTAANWNNGTPTLGNTASIDNSAAGSSTVTIGAVLRGVGTLAVSTGDSLVLGNFAGLQINGNGATSALSNNGQVFINATGNTTGLVFNQSGVGTISGNGTINMTGAGAGIVGSSTARVVNANTIRGNGTACGSIAFTNNGAIIAEGGTLTLRPTNLAGVGFINNGAMSATTGVLLLTGIGGGTFLNNGSMSTTGTGIIRLTSNASVTGGALSGTVRVGGAGAMENILNNASIIVEGNSVLSASGTFSNFGAITLSMSGAAGSEFRLLGNTTLSMGGSLAMTGSFTGIGDAGGASRLTNSGGHSIRGQGYIRNISLTNFGTISADAAGGTLTITPSGIAGGNFVNNLIVTAANGGTLVLDGPGGVNSGTFVNNGQIWALNNSVVQVQDFATINGGTLATEGSGTFRVPQNTDVRFHNVTSVANIEVENNSEILLTGTFLHARTITLKGNGNPTDVAISATMDLDGSGTVSLTGPGAGPNGSSAGVSGPAGSRLTNDTFHTIQGTGNIGRGQIGIINNGTIAANINVGTLTIEPNDGASGNFVSNGTVLAANGGKLRFDGSGGGTFAVFASAMNIDPISAFYVDDGAIARVPPITGNGMVFASGTASLTAPAVRISGLTVNSGATVKLLYGIGTQGSSATSVNVTDGQFDMTNHEFSVLYNGASPLDSIRTQIRSAFNGGAWTGNGITSSLAANTAATSDKMAIGYAEASDIFGAGGGTFGGIAVDNTTVLLRYTLFGDANLDRTVNITDFARVAANFNLPSTWFNGDFNYDGTTGISDFAMLAANFNKFASGFPRNAVVPEASSLAVVGIAAALKCHRRRRDSSGNIARSARHRD